MTLTPGQLQRKVRQLDNDMQATYEMLADISATQKRMGTRLDAVEEKVDILDGKVDALDSKVDALGVGLETLTDLVRSRG